MAVFQSGITMRFLLIVMFLSSNYAEPTCSKFHYEEALLEKMIRMEFEVKQMRDGIDKVKEEIMHELEKTKEVQVAVKTQSENLDQDWKNMEGQIETTVKDLITNVTTDIKKLASNVELIQELNEAKLMRISEDLVAKMDGKVSKVSDDKILFRAKHITDTTLSSGQAMIFETVLANEGGGYDPQTGVFTSPKEGVYIFSAQMCVSSGYFNFAFYIDDVSAQEMSMHKMSSGCNTFNMIVRINKGSRINMKSTTRGKTLDRTSNRVNMFTGTRIKP